LISIDSATTQQWLAGEYAVQGYVAKSGERYRIWEGTIVVEPDFVTAGESDKRSKARRILDFLDGSFERLAQKQAVQATIEGVQFQFRTLKELQDARNYWAQIVRNEDPKAGNKRVILAKFTRPGWSGED